MKAEWGTEREVTDEPSNGAAGWCSRPRPSQALENGPFSTLPFLTEEPTEARMRRQTSSSPGHPNPSRYTGSQNFPNVCSFQTTFLPWILLPEAPGVIRMVSDVPPSRDFLSPLSLLLFLLIFVLF